MTVLTYDQDTIMAYVGATADVVGTNITSCAPYWGGSSLYLFSMGASSNNGLRKFNIDPDGSETLQKKLSDIGVHSVNADGGSAYALSQDGTYLYFISNPFNVSELAQVNTADLTLNVTFGTAGVSTTSDSTHIVEPALMEARSTSLLVAPFPFAAEIDSIPIPGFNPNTIIGNLDTATSGASYSTLLGAVPNSDNSYAIGTPWKNTSIASTLSFRLYQINGGAITTIADIAPAAIDATWTHTLGVLGIAYDSTDGNLIIGVYTNDSVTHQKYIVKLRASNGQVMWTAPVTNLPASPHSFSKSRIVNGTYHCFDGSGLCHHIDTATGTDTQSTFAGLFNIGGPQFSDDVTNSIVLYAQFAETTPTPQYVGTYMSDLGHHNVTSWMRVWFETVPVTPPPDVSTLGVSFADFTDESFLDWNNDDQGVDYDSFLTTFYVHSDEEMFWMYSPYCYTFFATETGEAVVDSSGRAVVNSFGNLIGSSLPPSCFMSAKWDFTLLTDIQAPKETSFQQVYRTIDDKVVSVTKKKIRGKGRTVQLKYKSQTGRDFQLLGWGLVINKNTET